MSLVKLMLSLTWQVAASRASIMLATHSCLWLQAAFQSKAAAVEKVLLTILLHVFGAGTGV
jgi:hypothetical protein